MHISEFMSDRQLDDESMAALIRAQGVSCDRTTVLRLRNRKTWMSAPLAHALRAATDGLVTADECLPASVLEAAEARA
jgi:hypothetical protein